MTTSSRSRSRSRSRGRRISLLLGIITAVVILTQAPKFYDFFYAIDSVWGRWSCSEMGPQWIPEGIPEGIPEANADPHGLDRVYEIVEFFEDGRAQLHYREGRRSVLEFFRLETFRGRLLLYDLVDEQLRHEIPARTHRETLILTLHGRELPFVRDPDPHLVPLAPAQPPVAVNYSPAPLVGIGSTLPGLTLPSPSSTPDLPDSPTPR